MKIATKFFRKQFEAETVKEAYLDSCRWIASNIINEVEIGEILWNVQKVNDASLPTFSLELYVMLEEDKLQEGFCGRCREFHSAFFLNQQYNCDKCNMKALKGQLNKQLDVKKMYRKHQLKTILNK